MIWALLTFESFIGNGLQSVFGDSMWFGILTLVWFGAFTLLQGLRLDAKLAILVPAAILSLMFIPALSFIIVIVLAVILYLALMKFMRH